MRSVKCPVCGWRLMDEEELIESLAVMMDAAPQWYRPEYIIKCKVCKRLIGVRCINRKRQVQVSSYEKVPMM